MIRDIIDNELLPRDYDCYYLDSYKHVKEVRFDDRIKVIVLDEFEDLFLEILSNKVSDADMQKTEGIKKEITKIFESKAVIVIVIRDDRYHLLKLFGNFIPKISDSVILEKVSLNNKQDFDDFIEVVLEKLTKEINSNCEKFKNKIKILYRIQKQNKIFYHVNNESEIKKDISFFSREVTMFELHCFCALLTQYEINGKDLSLAFEFTPEDVLKNLIKECINSNDDPVLCVTVLYAILVRAILRTEKSASSIKDIIDAIDVAKIHDHSMILNILEFLGKKH